MHLSLAAKVSDATVSLLVEVKVRYSAWMRELQEVCGKRSQRINLFYLF